MQCVNFLGCFFLSLMKKCWEERWLGQSWWPWTLALYVVNITAFKVNFASANVNTHYCDKFVCLCYCVGKSCANVKSHVLCCIKLKPVQWTLPQTDMSHIYLSVSSLPLCTCLGLLMFIFFLPNLILLICIASISKTSVFLCPMFKNTCILIQTQKTQNH